MNNRKLLATGLVGTVVTAVCCFTPVLVIGLLTPAEGYEIGRQLPGGFLAQAA